MTKISKTSGGFIKMILLVVIALVLLKYIYSVDVIGFLTQGRPKELLDQIYNLALNGWEKYSEFIIKIWSYIIDFIKSLIKKI